MPSGTSGKLVIPVPGRGQTVKVGGIVGAANATAFTPVEALGGGMVWTLEVSGSGKRETLSVVS